MLGGDTAGWKKWDVPLNRRSQLCLGFSKHWKVEIDMAKGRPTLTIHRAQGKREKQRRLLCTV